MANPKPKAKQPSKSLKGCAARSAAGEKMGGRIPGKPNKATANAREAIARFVDENAERMQGWLDRIADEDPKAAFDRLMAVVEYHVPKLARTEVTGEGGGAVKTETTLVVKGIPPSE